jgi:hypothetical protein
MRENCQSGSMSGNRKQDQAKPDCGDEAKAQSTNHRETTVTAPVLDSTRDYTQNASCSCKRWAPSAQNHLVSGRQNPQLLGAVNQVLAEVPATGLLGRLVASDL